MKIVYCWDKSKYGPDDPEHGLGPNWKKKAFENTITQVVSSVYERGLPTGIQARIFGRILSELDKATTDVIEIETSEVEFLKSILFHEKALVHPTYARMLLLVQDEVERALKHDGE